jgi:hypothetical protein
MSHRSQPGEAKDGRDIPRDEPIAGAGAMAVRKKQRVFIGRSDDPDCEFRSRERRGDDAAAEFHAGPGNADLGSHLFE